MAISAQSDKQYATFGDLTGNTLYNGQVFVAGSGVTSVVSITETAYANLTVKDPTTLYVVIPD